jgi:hypothetical protein
MVGDCEDVAVRSSGVPPVELSCPSTGCASTEAVEWAELPAEAAPYGGSTSSARDGDCGPAAGCRSALACCGISCRGIGELGDDLDRTLAAAAAVGDTTVTSAVDEVETATAKVGVEAVAASGVGVVTAANGDVEAPTTPSDGGDTAEDFWRISVSTGSGRVRPCMKVRTLDG